MLASVRGAATGAIRCRATAGATPVLGERASGRPPRGFAAQKLSAEVDARTHRTAGHRRRWPGRSARTRAVPAVLAGTSGAVFASMMAYIAAQYCDVQLFHFFKRLTRGRHLWLRNNFSTLTSQLVDSVMVITVTFGAAFLAGAITLAAMLQLVLSNYLFKMVVALADTLPFYYLTGRLKRYLEIDNLHVLE